MDLDTSVSKLETNVKAASKVVAKADVLAQKYQFSPKHWNALTRAELKVHDRMDNFLPEHKRGRLKTQSTWLYALLGGFFMIASTAALWFFSRRKKDE